MGDKRNPKYNQSGGTDPTAKGCYSVPYLKKEMIKVLNKTLNLGENFRWGNLGTDKIRRILHAVLELKADLQRETLHKI